MPLVTRKPRRTGKRPRILPAPLQARSKPHLHDQLRGAVSENHHAF